MMRAKPVCAYVGVDPDGAHTAMSINHAAIATELIKYAASVGTHAAKYDRHDQREREQANS